MAIKICNMTKEPNDGNTDIENSTYFMNVIF